MVRWQHLLDKNSYQGGPNPPGWELLSRKHCHLTIQWVVQWPFPESWTPLMWGEGRLSWTPAPGSPKVNNPIHAADPYTPASKNLRASEMIPIHTKVISNNHHSYWITTAHLGWFCGCLYPQPTSAHGGFVPAPFEKSQLIQFLSKKENFNSISSQTLASTCWEKKLKNFITARYVHPLHWHVWGSSPYYPSALHLENSSLKKNSLGFMHPELDFSICFQNEPSRIPSNVLKVGALNLVYQPSLTEMSTSHSIWNTNLG
jgi:hypothetical protein